MLWLSTALASLGSVVDTLPWVPRVDVVPALFGEHGAVYVQGTSDANRVRLRGPDGRSIPVEAAWLERAVRLRPLDPLQPGSYSVDLLTSYTATGALARFKGNQAYDNQPHDAAYHVWVALPLDAAPTDPSPLRAPGPVTWTTAYGTLLGRLHSPSSSWMELEVDGIGAIGFVGPTGMIRPHQHPRDASGRARMVALGPDGARAPGPWTALPERTRAESGYPPQKHTPRTWTVVPHRPQPGPPTRLPTCTPRATEVLSATEHPPGQLLLDERGVVHAVSVEVLGAIVVDGVRHDVRPRFEQAVALRGYGDDLTVFGDGMARGVHLKSGDLRARSGADPVQAERFRLAGGTVILDRGVATGHTAGTVSQPVRLEGVLAVQGGKLVLHSIDPDEVWRVRSVDCGAATGPPTQVPPALLRQADVGVP